MKKTISILLLVLLIAGVITSCDNKLSNNSNETVSVTFSSDDGSRDLTSSNPFDVSALYWKYTAEKAADGTGLTQGATSEQRWIYGGSANNSTKKGLGVVGGFSQGLWNFTLYGYSDDAGSKLVCQGTTTTSIKFGTANNVNVQAKPITTGSGTGTLIINPITFTPNKGNVTKLTCKYTVTSVGDSTEKTGTLNDSEINISLNPGSYNVEIKFVDDNNIVYATGSKLVTIYSNLTTTLSGSLNELITSTGVDADGPGLKPIGGVIFHVAADNGATYTFYRSDKSEIEPSGGSFTVSDLLDAEYYTVSGKSETAADRFFVLYTENHLFTSTETDKVYWGFNNKDFDKIDQATTGKYNTTTIVKHIKDNDLLNTDNPSSTSEYKNCGDGNYVWDYIIAFNDATKTSPTGNTTGLYDWYIPSVTELSKIDIKYDTIKTKLNYTFTLGRTLISSSEIDTTRYRGCKWRSERIDETLLSSGYYNIEKIEYLHDGIVIRSF